MSLYTVKHTFTEGDTAAVRRYPLKRNGSAFDLTGYTVVKLYSKRHGGAAVAAITGSIVSPATAGIVSFDHTTIAATAGAYKCQIELTSVAGVERTPPFQNDVLIPVED